MGDAKTKKLVLSKTTLRNLGVRTGVRTGIIPKTGGCDTGGTGEVGSDGCDSEITDAPTCTCTNRCLNVTSICNFGSGGCAS